MDTPAPLRLPLRVPAPLLFVIGFAAGAALQSLIVLPQPTPLLREVSHDLGLLLSLCGLMLIVSGAWLFLRARTPLFPHGAASALVVRGPYRFSRNPMYLSVLLTYIGTCAVYWQPVALLLLPLPTTLLSRVVIPFEEMRMLDRFGDAYRDYCRRVRRWL